MNGEILVGRSVWYIGIDFSCENLLISVPKSGDLPPTISKVELDDFRFSPNSLGGWIGWQV